MIVVATDLSGVFTYEVVVAYIARGTDDPSLTSLLCCLFALVVELKRQLDEATEPLLKRTEVIRSVTDVFVAAEVVETATATGVAGAGLNCCAPASILAWNPTLRLSALVGSETATWARRAFKAIVCKAMRRDSSTCLSAVSSPSAAKVWPSCTRASVWLATTSA